MDTRNFFIYYQYYISSKLNFCRFILGMIIKANGRDLTKQFENSNYTLLTTNISIRWDNGKISALFLKPRKLHFLQSFIQQD